MKALVKLIFILSFASTASLSYADGGLMFLEKNQERNATVQGNDGQTPSK
ncbi:MULTISPECIES: hypothetical protein [Acinetobacter]|uniref:Uncharacterized protein n=1 Tax=Acinetobacter higginsii TaxID=70347 RepID=N9SZ62_9GAMM|nr:MULTISPECIES: hypothetical protein [Acinetobacter]ENV08527.1 hypothetical protein F966_03201 [Acinetobacter higginsii]ENX60091.1 hypothetical protein F885_02283 [Acinetobacter higginsii]MCH7294026.1 hypothetical protein [Acinetobacter higginsii]MCH7305142.1 hypothetical protein [Acinetobacter higginsii]MCH7316428.1 hypothetical protein [Acinetobacter higginsii]